MSHLERWWNEGVWAARLEFRARRGWIIRPQDALKLDGAAHVVRAIEFGLAGW